MEHYYPCKGSSSQAEKFCTSCNTVQNPTDACKSTSSKNGTENKYTECSSFCDTTVCNSSCNTAQTVCVKMGQYIKNHGDVGSYPIDTVQPDDIIAEKWSIDFWNSLIDKLETAESVGFESPQGSAKKVAKPLKTAAITASFYNNIKTKIDGFTIDSGYKYSEVAVNDLITATVANAIRTAYNHAKFDSSVCDACNSDQSIHAGCGCNCSCSCSCPCGCTCPCTCSCGCTCTCTCTSPCTCGTNNSSAEAVALSSIWSI